MKKVSGFIILAAIGLLIGCYKEVSFDVKPAIEFRSLKKEIRIDQFAGSKKDSVILTIKFQDGDGDLGLNEKEKTAAELTNDFNYIIKIFRKRRGVFTEFIPDVPYSGYFPRLKADVKISYNYKMITEIVLYRLRPNKSEEFNKLFMEQSLPMLKHWKINVIDYGFSMETENSFYLNRNYISLRERQQS